MFSAISSNRIIRQPGFSFKGTPASVIASALRFNAGLLQCSEKAVRRRAKLLRTLVPLADRSCAACWLGGWLSIAVSPWAHVERNIKTRPVRPYLVQSGNACESINAGKLAICDQNCLGVIIAQEALSALASALG